VSVAILLPLFLQSTFWETFYLNFRYTALTLPGELISNLLQKTIQTFHILVLDLLPISFFFFLMAIIVAVVKRSKLLLLASAWVLTGVSINIFSLKGVNERYLVSFLPLVCVLISYFITTLKHKNYQYISIFLLIITAETITLLQVFAPVTYFRLLSSVSSKAFIEYREGFSSGFGVSEAVKFLEKRIGDQPAFIATAVHTGNPESGIMTAFMKRDNVVVSYLEASYINDIYSYDCLSSQTPLYFVSRENDLAGLERYFQQLYFERSPISNFGIGIYTLKEQCQGNTLNLKGYKT